MYKQHNNYFCKEFCRHVSIVFFQTVNYTCSCRTKAFGIKHRILKIGHFFFSPRECDYVLNFFLCQLLTLSSYNRIIRQCDEIHSYAGTTQHIPWSMSNNYVLRHFLEFYKNIFRKNTKKKAKTV